MNNIALIPSYNPDDKLVKLVKELTDNKFKVIVVNDGSDKEHSSVFDVIKKECILLNHKDNKGKGCALKTGIKYIIDNYEDATIVTIDADGQHSVSDAVKICEYCNKHLNYFVIGSRRLDKNSPLRSRIGNSITRLVYSITTGTKIYDTQSGLRAFSKSLAKELLNIYGERYEYEINVLLYLTKRKIPIKELRIKTIYINDNESSHFNTIKDSYRIYREIFKQNKKSL